MSKIPMCHKEYDFMKSGIVMHEKVQVYRNLHKGCWSIKQKGLVKAHATDVIIHDVRFKVSERGRQRVIRDQRKSVHAYATGYLMFLDHLDKEYDLVRRHWADRNKQDYVNVTYNPYKHPKFYSQYKFFGVFGDPKLYDGCTVAYMYSDRPSIIAHKPYSDKVRDTCQKA